MFPERTHFFYGHINLEKYIIILLQQIYLYYYNIIILIIVDLTILYLS